MSERKAEPEASFAAAAISGKEAEPWRAGIVGWEAGLSHCSDLAWPIGWSIIKGVPIKQAAEVTP